MFSLIACLEIFGVKWTLPYKDNTKLRFDLDCTCSQTLHSLFTEFINSGSDGQQLQVPEETDHVEVQRR